MRTDYDVIVIGAGPNGLTAAAYLAAGGKRVAVVDRYVETGGGLVTQEISGFRMNHHATYMMMGDLMPPVADFDLRSRGVDFITPEIQAAFLFENRQSLIIHADSRKTEASVEALSPNDGARFRRMHDEFSEMCDAFLLPATYVPPVAPIDQTIALQNSDEVGKRIASISDLSPIEVIERYEFEDPRIKAAFLYLATCFGLEASEGGLGFLVPIYVSRMMQASLVRGGSHQLASALRRTVEEHGGQIFTNSPVKQLLVEDGRVVGLDIPGRGQIRAEAVLSTLNPEQTFLELLPREVIGRKIEEGISNWEWEPTSLFVFNDGIIGEAPIYEGYPEAANHALLAVMGYEKPEDVVDHQAEVARGDRSRIAGHGSTLSLFDPLMAPNHVSLGGPPAHVLRWESWAPYNADWRHSATADYTERCLEFWARYAPSIANANSRARVTWSPRDIEAHLPTMKRGSIKHGAYISLQMGGNRPIPECSGYRTPIEGLYVGGSGTHPGGMVIMGPGYNSARIVAEDIGADFPDEPEMVVRARARGYFDVDEES